MPNVPRTVSAVGIEPPILSVGVWFWRLRPPHQQGIPFQSSSQDVDSRRPEHVIEEKDAEDEDKDEDEDGSDTSNKEEKQHVKARTEDQVNIMAILLTIHHMQEKIDLIMMNLSLDDGSEAAVVTP